MHMRHAAGQPPDVDEGNAILRTIAIAPLMVANLLWPPDIPVRLIVLAFPQIGVHLAFFLHIATEPDHTTNIIALAFGLLIAFLVIARLVLDHCKLQCQHGADATVNLSR
jgi:heme/copper-type cytochrome/quinol oxidase subunit 4